jgi:lipopolysaccharide assembly outer membrane protein LptD (OstA)
MTEPNTIKIIIERGLVAGVANLPGGWSYEVEDRDDRQEESASTADAQGRRLYAVHYDFRDGEREYGETTYFRATPARLTRSIRTELREASIHKTAITWSLEHQWASADDTYAYDLTAAVQITAEEIQAVPEPRIVVL